MKTLSVEEAKALKGSDLLNLLTNVEVLILTEKGEGRYILSAVDELEWEVFSLSRNAEFMSYLDACRARGDREGSVSLEEARRLLAESSQRGS